MTVTIKDVACEARVSVATVSRALNGQQNVAEAVRQRVQAVAARLRYTPHHAARSLSSRRTRTIGVVLPEVHGEFFSELSPAYTDYVTPASVLDTLEPVGNEIFANLRLGGHRLVARLPPQDPPPEGHSVGLALRGAEVLFFDPDSGARLPA